MQISVSVLKSYPFTCLNRGDNGQPKCGRYGNDERTIVTSQCQNHSVKTYLNSLTDDPYIVTKEFPSLFENALEKQGISKKIITNVKTNLAGAGKRENSEDDSTEAGTSDKKDSKCAAKVFLQTRKSVIDNVINMLIKDITANGDITNDIFYDINKTKKTKKLNILKAIGKEDAKYACSAYELMSGRMCTDTSIPNRDSACNTAFGISTNGQEHYLIDDFFTTCDDLSSGGAGQLGCRTLTAPTMFYQHVFNIDKMLKNDSDDSEMLRAGETKESFIEKSIDIIDACIKTDPEAMQTATFHTTYPSAVLIEFNANNDTTHHVSAFRNTVNPKKDPVDESIAKLVHQINDVDIKVWGTEADRYWFVPEEEYQKYSINGANNSYNYKDFLNKIKEALVNYVNTKIS